MKNDYQHTTYHAMVKHSVDKLGIKKIYDSDCVEIYMKTNDLQQGSLTIRGQEMAEHLHFMLGELLERVRG